VVRAERKRQRDAGAGSGSRGGNGAKKKRVGENALNLDWEVAAFGTTRMWIRDFARAHPADFAREYPEYVPLWEAEQVAAQK
jgi:hypothetical protein